MLLTLVWIGARLIVLDRYCCGYSFLVSLVTFTSLTQPLHYSWFFFTVRSVLFSLGAFIETNVELRGIIHEINLIGASIHFTLFYIIYHTVDWMFGMCEHSLYLQRVIYSVLSGFSTVSNKCMTLWNYCITTE